MPTPRSRFGISSILALALIASGGHAQSPSAPPAAYSVGAAYDAAQRPAPTPLAFATGGFIALSVPDLEASASWYTERLGLARTMTIPRQGSLAGVILLEGPGLTVELIQLDSARAGPERPEMLHGISKAGILVTEFDSTVARLRAGGITFFFGPYPPRNGNRANVAFKDNSGNLIQILGPSPSVRTSP